MRLEHHGRPAGSLLRLDDTDVCHRLTSKWMLNLAVALHTQIMASKKTLGLVRSPLQPEETRGLTRSDDLSRMLPFEAHLIAASRRRDADGDFLIQTSVSLPLTATCHMPPFQKELCPDQV